jgi:hypothetical protein
MAARTEVRHARFAVGWRRRQLRQQVSGGRQALDLEAK